MANFFTENSDRQFHFKNFDIQKIVSLIEENYEQHKQFDHAPENYDDAMDTYKKILETAGQICAEVIAPLSKSVDEEGAHFINGEVEYAEGTKIALETLKKAELFGTTLPRRFGGLNLPNVINNVIIEMISEADASLQNIYGLQDIAVTINKFASEEQKARVLPKFCTGEYSGAMDLTEAEAGSDLQAVNMKSGLKIFHDDKDDTWRLNGVKRFITNGCADVHLVLARSEEGTNDARGLSMFLYLRDKDMKIRRIEDKLGIHGSPTTELQFNNAKCELVGKRKMGLIRYVMSLMNGARLGISLQALGVAQCAYNKALKYAMERKQFGKKIIEFAPIYDMLTNNRMDIEATRSLVYKTSMIVDELELIEDIMEHKGDTLPKEKMQEYRARVKFLSKKAALFTPLSKFLSTEMGNKVCYDAIQIHGGCGFTTDFDVERHYRDVRITNIYEGTTQLQVIAAIGGIMTKEIFEDYEQFRKKAEGHQGEFHDVYEKLKQYEKMLSDAIEKVQEKKEKDYFEYQSRNLVDLALLIYISYQFMEEAKKSPTKALFARKFAIERLPGFEIILKKVLSGDETTIRNYEQLLEVKV